MAPRHLKLTNLQVAPRGSKKGWPTRTVQLPPELDARLSALQGLRAAKGQPYRETDLLREAVEAYLAGFHAVAA